MEKGLSFYGWPEIESFHQLYYLNRLLLKEPIVYRGKIKLHGTCASVQIKDNKVIAQSRRCIVKKKKDSYKWAQFVEDNASYFLSLVLPMSVDYSFTSLIIFGEWAGSKIQKGAAICELSNPIFGIFAISLDNKMLIVNPEIIESIIHKGDPPPPQIHVLPWITPEYIFDFFNLPLLEKTVEPINELVKQVDKEDPWVKQVFNISGIGEGLVFYPISLCDNKGLMEFTIFGKFVFKAKGVHHSVYKSSESIQCSVDVIESVGQFVEKFVTENRLEQGFQEALKGNTKHSELYKLINWVLADVKKESTAELETNQLDFSRNISVAITAKVTKWFNDKISNTEH